MDTFQLIVTFCFTLVVVAILFRPLFSVQAENGGLLSADQVALQDQRERCLQVLKDLQLDYDTDKVSAEDYSTTKATLSVELASILQKMKGATDG